MKYLTTILLSLAVAAPGLGSPILVFNPQSHVVTVPVTFEPAAAGLAGIAADHIVLTINGEVLPSQAEDSDGDGKLTDRDTVYAAVDAAPGNNWLDATVGKPIAAPRRMSARRAGEHLQIGWLKLDTHNGRPLACLMPDGAWLKLDLDLSTAAGQWSNLEGAVTVSDLPLRTRVQFISKGPKPVQITLFVYQAGRCDVDVQYPEGVPPKAWTTNYHIAEQRYIMHGVMVDFPLPSAPRYHWMTRAGAWYETLIGRDYPIHPFFAGLPYPEHQSALGLCSLSLDPNVGNRPWRMKMWDTPPEDKTWRVSCQIYLTRPQHRFALVRYTPRSRPAEAPRAIRDLYLPPQVYVGEELREMIEARLGALQAGFVGKSSPLGRTLAEAQSALQRGALQDVVASLEQVRARMESGVKAVLAAGSDLPSVGAVAAALGEADTLLAAQAQDRAHPRRFIWSLRGQKSYSVDRLVRADERLAQAWLAAARARRLSGPRMRKNAESQVAGTGEAFRVGFGLSGGVHRELLHLEWGIDYFEPLIDVGIRNFHLARIHWTVHAQPDGTTRHLGVWERLLDAFDQAGVTAVPQFRLHYWGTMPGWVERKYPDSFYEYEIEEAGVNGVVAKRTGRGVMWMAPDIWGAVSSLQRDFTEFCRQTVQQLKHHRCIVGWAGWNEPSASAHREFTRGPLALAGFRKYLRLKYRTIDELNRAWASDYASFDEVPGEAPGENVRTTIASLDLSGTWRFAVDPANRGYDHGWTAADFDDSSWATIQVPGYWEEQLAQYRNYDGFAWYRRIVTIPADWSGNIVRFECAGIDDDADIYVNGTLAARNVGYSVPISVECSGLVKPGEQNCIAIRVNDTYLNGGIYKPVMLSAESPTTPPPRFQQPQRQLDREMYAQENWAGICLDHSRVLRSADPLRPVFAKEWVLKTPTEDPSTQLDSFLLSRAHFDAVGCDMYKPMVWYPMAIDLLRSANHGKPIWLMETIYYSPAMNAPESLLQWTWAMAVRGLRSVYIWGDRWGYEGDDCINDFGVAMGKMQRHFDALSPILSARRRVETAIYMPRDSQFLCERGRIDSSWQQLWRLLNAINVPVDFVDDGRISAGELRQYRCLLVPHSPYMPPGTAQALQDYVTSGGSVLMWPGSVVYDYQGNVQPEAPGWGLVDLFGARMVPKTPQTAQVELRSSLCAEVINCDTGAFAARLLLQRAIPLVDDGAGRVAVSLNRVGRGHAVLMAVNIGELFARASERQRLAIGRLMWALLGRCGVKHALYCYQPDCEAHLLERDGAAWLVLINHTGQVQTMTVTTRPNSKRRLQTVYDALTLRKIALEMTAVGQRGRYVVPAYGVRIVKVAG